MGYPKKLAPGPQSMDRRLWRNGLFDVWIIVRTFPGKFPPDPENCDANGQPEHRKEQITDFHEHSILVHFKAPVCGETF